MSEEKKELEQEEVADQAEETEKQPERLENSVYDWARSW